MAKRGRFGTGGSGSTAAGDVIRNILSMQSTGETAAPAGTTDGTASPRVPKPDYSGLDFTGMDRQEVKKAKRATWSPEYTAQVKAGKARMRRYTDPFTAEQIASDPAKQAIASGITYQQALAAYRKQVKWMNMMPVDGKGSTAKAEKFYKTLTPIQRNAQRILGLLGGFGKDYGGRTAEQTYRERIFGQLGMDISKVPNYAPVKETYEKSDKFGEIIKVDNPLNATQSSRLQRLRALGTLNKKQVAALARLRAKKNAPTILP